MKSLLTICALVALFVSADAQVGPCGTPIGPLLPNLVAYANVSKATAFVSIETFSDTHCSVMEGEITAGTHKLLRFTSRTGNIGEADLNIGSPTNCPGLFEYSVCHGHYHVRGYTAYRLWTQTGYDNWVMQRDLSQPVTGTSNQQILNMAEMAGQLVTSHKQGFCLKDTTRLSGTPEYTRNEYGVRILTSHFRSCNEQGLTVGWGDEYVSSLDGQYVVIDWIVPGWYVLEIHANPDHLLPESSYTDNSSAASTKIQ